MRALSIRQPWAELIAAGRKTIETREWRTAPAALRQSLIGHPLAIHASATEDWRTRPQAEHFELDPFKLDYGYIVAIAQVVDVVTCVDALHEKLALCPCEGLVGIVVGHVRRLRFPQPFRGRLGFFPVPDELIDVGLRGLAAVKGMA